jgi:hypothetical protein
MIDNLSFWFGFLSGFLVAWISILILWLFRGVNNEEV